ncbi:Arc family DNA-binding protein [Xanthobacter autotrophicus]|uniref:Arc family DNA-binding protein n=1 Tax=Xanthobacter autotrophicus TaxID=280 RepID=UPI003728AD25
MSKKPFPSQTQDRFIVRLPDGLRDRIAAAAKANGRSMNSEIVRALMLHFPPPPSAEDIIAELDMIADALTKSRGAAMSSVWQRLQARLEEVRELVEANPSLLIIPPAGTDDD